MHIAGPSCCQAVRILGPIQRETTLSADKVSVEEHQAKQAAYAYAHERAAWRESHEPKPT